MQDVVNGLSVEQRQNAVRIARKELRRWMGQPIALFIGRVVRTCDRYKVTGMVGPKGLDVRPHTGFGCPYTLIFGMSPDGDSYEVAYLMVDDPRGQVKA